MDAEWTQIDFVFRSSIFFDIIIMEAERIQNAFIMGAKWMKNGFKMDALSSPSSESWMDAEWINNWCRVDVEWMQNGLKMDVFFRMDFDGCRMASTWVQNEYRMDSKWMPCLLSSSNEI